MNDAPAVTTADPGGSVGPVQSERIRQLHAGIPSAVVNGLLLGVITAWVLWNAVAPAAVMLGWIAAFVTAQLARLGIWVACRPVAGMATIQRLTLMRAGALFSGLGWGALPLSLFPADFPHQVFLAFVAAGVTGAAIATLASDRVSALLFVVPVLVPLIARLIMEGGELPTAMGVMGLLYLVYLVAAARRGEQAFRDTQQLRERTDRQNAELHEAQRLARLGSWSLDAASGKIEWSPEAYAIFGRDPQTFRPDLATYYRELVHPDDVQVVQREEQLAYRVPGQRHSIDHRVYLPDGTVRWMHVEGTATLGADGQAATIRGTVQDITERKRIEQALQESEQRYRETLDQAPALVWVADTGNMGVWYNQRWLEYTGRTMAQELGFGWIDGMHPDDRERCATYCQSFFDRRERFEMEFRLRRADGSYGWIVDTGIPRFAPDGTFGGYIGYCWDVTDRKKMEQLKSEFISTVSHELRTPLTSIRGSLSLLAGGAVDRDPDKARELVQIAHRNAERLSRLINDILDIEKIASGKMKFDLKPQPLLPLVEQALAVNRAYAEQYNVSFRLAARAEHGMIHTDAERFQQVMANLLSNAAKFSPAGETVEVAVAACNTGLRITVTDRGPGIPEEFRPRLFEKFSQADASDTRPKGGTGLGLAITRELVERMGGRIGYTPGAESGTTFWVEFPAAGSRASADEQIGE